MVYILNKQDFLASEADLIELINSLRAQYYAIRSSSSFLIN